LDYILNRVCLIQVGEVGGGGRVNIAPPKANFKTLFNKNVIKPEIGGPHPRQYFMKALTHLGISAKTTGTPSPGFSICVHLWTDTQVNVNTSLNSNKFCKQSK
jgi:hypothetical protein